MSTKLSVPVTAIGLGKMRSALAHALLSAKQGVVVYLSNGTNAVWPDVNRMMLQAVVAGNCAKPQASINTWAAARRIADIVGRPKNH